MHPASHTITPVILSGGSGTRLWPLSRELHPKQVLPLVGQHSLLQQTARRVSGPTFADPLVVCGDSHRFIIAEQLRALDVEPRAIVLEPVGRNTAPAIAAAALLLTGDGADRRTSDDALMLVCPSDHHIGDSEAFLDAVSAAAAVATEGYLVTFGIPAHAPETGYGYIRAADPIEGHRLASRVAEFVEKPTAEVARGLVAQGTWSWNSGLFMFSTRLFLEELRRYAPDIEETAVAAVRSATPDLDFVRLGSPEFTACRSISVDHAVMEHTRRAAVVCTDFGWDDVGSWSSLWRMGRADAAGNVVAGDVVDRGSTGCYVRSEGALVATVGLEDTVVVATADVVLVADRTRDQEIKEIVSELKQMERQEAISHPVVHRPWGSYEVIDTGLGYQVKHLSVRPGQQLSLQVHAQRAEHWVVVSGTADVVRGEDRLTIGPRMSIDIPIGCVHRLGNSGPDALHLIEVQTGTYLGEDDIVRLEDVYGRNAVVAPV